MILNGAGKHENYESFQHYNTNFVLESELGRENIFCQRVKLSEKTMGLGVVFIKREWKYTEQKTTWKDELLNGSPFFAPCLPLCATL